MRFDFELYPDIHNGQKSLRSFLALEQRGRPFSNRPRSALCKQKIGLDITRSNCAQRPRNEEEKHKLRPGLSASNQLVFALLVRNYEMRTCFFPNFSLYLCNPQLSRFLISTILHRIASGHSLPLKRKLLSLRGELTCLGWHAQFSP